MRDVVANDRYGNLSFTTHSACAEDHVYSVQSKRSAVRRRARGNLVSGNHINATAYRAYDYGCTSATVKGVKPPTLEYCDGRWHTVSVASYSGKAAIPSWSLIRPYMQAGGYPSVPTDVVAIARNRALGRLNDSDVDLGQTIGELGETGQLIANTTVNLLRALNALRKGKMGDAAFYLGIAKVKGRKMKARKDLGGGNIADVLSDRDSTIGVPGGELHNRWLEFQYGWKPLLSDIYNMSNAVSSAFAQPEGLASVKVVEEQQRSLAGKSSSRYDVHGTATVGVEIGLKYRVHDERLAALSALGLTNPLSLAWELLPLSFVFDWFVSVGNFLSGYGAHHGLTFVTGYETHFVHSKGHTVIDNYYPLSGYDGEPAVFHCDCKCHRRYPSSDWPTPGIALSMNLNLSKLTSLMALSLQQGKV